MNRKFVDAVAAGWIRNGIKTKEQALEMAASDRTNRTPSKKTKRALHIEYELQYKMESEEEWKTTLCTDSLEKVNPARKRLHEIYHSIKTRIIARQVEKEHNSYIFFHSENFRRLRVFMEELACELLEPTFCSNDITFNLFSLILSDLLIAYSKHNEEKDRRMNSTSISSVLSYIEKNFRTCTLAETADHFALNPSYLSQLIRAKLQVNNKDLVLKQKLYYAVSLLKNTDRAVADIAHEAGFENMTFFYRKFEQSYACTPKEFRQASAAETHQ